VAMFAGDIFLSTDHSHIEAVFDWLLVDSDTYGLILLVSYWSHF